MKNKHDFKLNELHRLMSSHMSLHSIPTAKNLPINEEIFIHLSHD